MAVEIRRGEAREVTVPVANVGELDGVWALVESTVGLGEGVTVAVGPPSTVEIVAGSEGLVTVELSVGVLADVGSGSIYRVALMPPEDDTFGRGRAGVAIVVRVVDEAAVIGPAAVADFVGASASGVSFDPGANDLVGDAPLDPVSLRIVGEPTSGSLTVTAPGELTYIPGSLPGDGARYEVCDTSGLCTQGQLNLYAVP